MIGRVAVIMASNADIGMGEKIREECRTFGIPCDLRITSAHKGTDSTLKILAEYEGVFGLPYKFT